jgi:hypothetical protein
VYEDYDDEAVGAPSAPADEPRPATPDATRM